MSPRSLSLIPYSDSFLPRSCVWFFEIKFVLSITFRHQIIKQNDMESTRQRLSGYWGHSALRKTDFRARDAAPLMADFFFEISLIHICCLSGQQEASCKILYLSFHDKYIFDFCSRFFSNIIHIYFTIPFDYL